MKLRGKMVKLLVQLDPTIYQKYITTGPKGEPTLYVKLLKALYGLLRSALLFSKSYGNILRIWGSKSIHMIYVWLPK